MLLLQSYKDLIEVLLLSIHNHHQQQRHHHHHHLLLLLLLVTPLTGPEIDPGISGPPINCVKEMIESATLNPLCYPNSYLAELQFDPLSLLFTAGAWLDSLPQVINNRPNSESLQMTGYQLEGSASLCPPTTKRWSPTIGGPSSSSSSSSSFFFLLRPSQGLRLTLGSVDHLSIA